MLDRGVRSLQHLQGAGSTSRVLNLTAIARVHGKSAEWAAQPMFQNRQLNRALIIKHRLRRDELRLLSSGQKVATKIVLPFDEADLKVGGRVVLVGETDYDAQMHDILGEGWSLSGPDAEMLQTLDGIPTLDPFLLREQLRRHQREPARCYFEISDADLARMHAFVADEVRQLVLLCYAQGPNPDGATSKLVSKILSSKMDAEAEPLRLTLRLEPGEFEEGVFCWKGFLYYKWQLQQTLAQVPAVAAAFGKVKPRDAISPETAAYLQDARRCLRGGIVFALEDAKRGLAVYDAAFDSLASGEPLAFREFLLKAPSMFWRLGEQLGAVEHIVSYWTYRFPMEQPQVATADELADIFSEFAQSLGVPETPAQAASMPGVGMMPKRTRSITSSA